MKAEAVPAREKRAPLFSWRYLFYDFVKLTAVLPVLVWLRPKWRYESREARRFIRGGALVVANHASFIDPVCVMTAVWYRRHHFVCLKEFFTGPKRFLFRGFRCIPIDREDFSLASLRQIADTAASGRIVSLFPEGHVTRDADSTAAFKSGAVLMAMQSGRPIVPVYIRPPKRFPERLLIAVGEPVRAEAPGGGRPNMRQIGEISQRMREKEEALRRLALGIDDGKDNAS